MRLLALRGDVDGDCDLLMQRRFMQQKSHLQIPCRWLLFSPFPKFVLTFPKLGCEIHIFHPKSPRNVTPEQARTIVRGLSGRARRVGVFVSQTTRSGLKAASRDSKASSVSSAAMPSRNRISCPAFFSIVAAVAGTTGKM